MVGCSGSWLAVVAMTWQHTGGDVAWLMWRGCAHTRARQSKAVPAFRVSGSFRSAEEPQLTARLLSPPHQVFDLRVEGQPAPARALRAAAATDGSRTSQAMMVGARCRASLGPLNGSLQSQLRIRLALSPALHSLIDWHALLTCTPAALALNCFCSASSAPNSASIACSSAPAGGSYSCVWRVASCSKCVQL